MRAILIAGVLTAATSVAAQPTARSLLETTQLGGLAVSPDQTLLAFRTDQASLEDNSRRMAWWVTDAEGHQAPRRIADAGRPLWTDAGVLADERPIWSADGRWIYYRALIDGALQVWRAAPSGGAVQQVTTDTADVTRFLVQGPTLIYGVRRPRAEIIAREKAEYDQGIRIDASVDPAQALTGAIEINGRLATQRLAGSWFDRRGLLDREPERVFSVDLVTLKARPATSDEVAALGPSPIDTPAPAIGLPILRARSEAFGEARLVRNAEQVRLEIERPTGEILVCAEPTCDARTVTSLTWASGQDLVLVGHGDAFRHTKLRVWRPGSGQEQELAHANGLDNGGGAYPSACALAGAAAICVHAGPSQAPRLDRIPLDGRSRTILFAPAGSTRPAGYTVKAMTWRDADGQMFTGQLLLPAGSDALGRRPLFISYYNCAGYLTGGEGDAWPMPVMAARGIAALCINKPPHAVGDMVAQYDLALSGIVAIVDQLAHDGVIDRSRVGMGGLSFGSEVTLWVARYSQLLAAVSVASLQIEPSYYWLNGVAGRDHHALVRQVWGLGAPDETPERWRLVSPALSSEKLRAPVLLQLPEQELRSSIELFARLSNTSTPAELYGFPNEPHILVQPRHRLATYTRNLDWFDFWLRGVEDPDPLKTEQYARWRALAARAPQRPAVSAKPGP